MICWISGKDPCTDANEQSEPSEPNGEPVWTAIHIRHVTFCTEYYQNPYIIHISQTSNVHNSTPLGLEEKVFLPILLFGETRLFRHSPKH